MIEALLYDEEEDRTDLFFFFFQAEDGIRDLTVTGVQTCALPIYRARRERIPDAGDGLDCRPFLRAGAERGVQGIVRQARADDHQGLAGEPRGGARELVGERELAALESRHA